MIFFKLFLIIIFGAKYIDLVPLILDLLFQLFSNNLQKKYSKGKSLQWYLPSLDSLDLTQAVYSQYSLFHFAICLYLLHQVKQKALIFAEMTDFKQRRDEDDVQLHNDIDDLIEAINKSVFYSFYPFTPALLCWGVRFWWHFVYVHIWFLECVSEITSWISKILYTETIL